jgi:alpha-ribazole phosphatase
MNETNPQERLRLHLIRHAEVEDAATGRLLGRTDTPLSAHGLAQARNLGKELSTAQVSAIYSSDLQRARITAETLAKYHRVKVQESSAWSEINMGEWEGRTFKALHEEAPVLVTQLFEDPASFEYPGGESFAVFTARVQQALDHLLMSHHSGEVVLVAHGGVCRALIGIVLGVPVHNWLRLAQEYGCLNVIDWYGANPILQVLNLKNKASVHYARLALLNNDFGNRR